MPGHRLVVVAVGAVLVAALSVVLTNTAGARAGRCAQFRSAAADPARTQMGAAGPRILVIGDSYSVGLKVRPDQSWPHRLKGRVVVDGFSGSGFSARASGCGAVSYADRAAAVVSSAGHVDVVVVEGGLNDHDQSTRAIRRGFERLLAELEGRRVIVVGPAAAPSRIQDVPRVDRILAGLCARHHVHYVRMSGMRLSYLAGRLHLTPQGHREFGDRVARAVAG